jgi:hypothetical protein
VPAGEAMLNTLSFLGKPRLQAKGVELSGNSPATDDNT